MVILVVGGWVAVAIVAGESHASAVAVGANVVFSVLTVAALVFRRQVVRLERLACRDELTGAYNYRYLREQLAREIARSGRRGTPLALLMVDLRDFKGYNDRYGHLAGNRALAGVVRIIYSEVRSGDTVARFGGDEFAVILPDVSEKSAWQVGDRLAGRLAASFEGLAADVGVAGYAGGTADDLLHAADLAMYIRKREG